MNKNYLRMFFAVSAAAAFMAGSVQAAEMAGSAQDAEMAGSPQAAEMPGTHQVSGTIGMVDTIEGIMQLRMDVPQGGEETREFRINQDETRVKNSEDNDFLVVKDLKVGEHITVQVVDGKEDAIVQRIILDPVPYTPSGSASSTQITGEGTTGNNEPYIQRGDNADIVGPRGATGPAGPVGEQGYTGATGPAGAALSGPRGETGPAGPVGEQGVAGPMGYNGTIERGAMGATGDAGPQGARGDMGATGAQGASLAGYAGPTGSAGPIGPQGPMGNRGEVGPTLVGPTGPAGYEGPTGDQGMVGAQGPQGSTTAGAPGERGPSGVMGATGPRGENGEQGSTGMLNSWTLYREFYFDSQDNDISQSEMLKVTDIAAYVKQNPSVQIGIDARGSNSARFHSVLNALIQAGVPSDTIKKGVFGDRRMRRNGEVEALLRTAR